MIIEAKIVKLIEIYLFVCDKFENELKYCCERFSNNDKPLLTDQEIMTIYLFAVHEEQKFNVKQIHRYAREYLLSWFPDIGSYSAFNMRLNRLTEAFRLFVDLLIAEFKPSSCCLNESLLDSMPIITCSGKRTGKVAPELVNKGYCSSKSMYYFGLKLHMLGFRHFDKLPYPEQLVFSPASENDLAVFKECWSGIQRRTFYGDKIYNDKDFFKNMGENNNSFMFTPVKAVKGQNEWEKTFNRAADDLFSRAVSAVRQPIEAFFNWLNEKTKIQIASKVRSTQGLIIHVFGKIAAAFISNVFNT